MTNLEIANLLEKLALDKAEQNKDECHGCTWHKDDVHEDWCSVPRALAAAKELRKKHMLEAPFRMQYIPPPDAYIDEQRMQDVKIPRMGRVNPTVGMDTVFPGWRTGSLDQANQKKSEL